MINPKRIYFLMIGLNIVLFASILGISFIGENILKTHSDELVAKKVEYTLLEKEQENLVQAKQDLEEYADLKDIAAQVVPQEKDQAATTREIVRLAEKAGVSIGSIGFPKSDLGETTQKSPISQAEAVKGTKGLLVLDINVISDNQNPSTYQNFIQFLKNLENNRRTSQVSTISIQPVPDNPSLLNFSLTVKVYLKP